MFIVIGFNFSVINRSGMSITRHSMDDEKNIELSLKVASQLKLNHRNTRLNTDEIIDVIKLIFLWESWDLRTDDTLSDAAAFGKNYLNYYCFVIISVLRSHFGEAMKCCFFSFSRFNSRNKKTRRENKKSYSKSLQLKWHFFLHLLLGTNIRIEFFKRLMTIAASKQVD